LSCNRIARSNLASQVATSQVATSYPVAAQYNPEANKGSVIDQGKKFTWIKADPKLSQQIQEYVREHEANLTLSPFNSSLTPKIRTVSFLPEQKDKIPSGHQSVESFGSSIQPGVKK
jgi:hypothetical protein